MPTAANVVNRNGDLPALIVRVDTPNGIVTVHALGAEAPPGRSLELWYIAAGKAPKSLGVVENAPEPVVIPAMLRPDGVQGAFFAVTAEPKGAHRPAAPPVQSSIRVSSSRCSLTGRLDPAQDQTQARVTT
jgi:anti-sigma-K factor RskA